MPKISAVIITHNEEANIEACVTALISTVDEVLIVDSNSDDHTRAIAKKAGAKVIQTNWLGYASTKNFGNALATNDWILSIDADEVLSNELIKSIQNIQLKNDQVYALDRLTNFCGQWIKHSGWYPEWKVRLFNRTTTTWVGKFVHEQLEHQDNPQVKKIQGKLYHYSYKTLDDHWQRIEKYAKLSALEMQSKGKKSNFIKLWISPIVRFIKTFFIKAGFLDGKNGWIISIRNARLVHLKYKLLKALNQS